LFSVPTPSDFGGVNIVGLLFLVVLLALAFAPMLLGRGGSQPGQGDSDADEGGGGGGGPRRPRTPHDLPGGGIPLSEVTQSRMRLRGPRRLASMRRERRRSREPGRVPRPRVPQP
jgi:hypothetical protein